MSALDLTCANMTTLTTDYLEHALPPREHTTFETHLVFCEDCLTYVDQIRATRDQLRALRAPALDDEERARLLEAFRAHG